MAKRNIASQDYDALQRELLRLIMVASGSTPQHWPPLALTTLVHFLLTSLEPVLCRNGCSNRTALSNSASFLSVHLYVPLKMANVRGLNYTTCVNLIGGRDEGLNDRMLSETC